ncbi:hypothetical protein TCON_0124 [Astathelohania contejeani]|uniref:Uncharacterized protein n=1 Tax=Astathelohania contejeani TaxID=164912 RepID=A0ABQ7I2H8_9MICR|nr:hypothetical protein TCON_0124 [Thelohania contejeani]
MLLLYITLSLCFTFFLKKPNEELYIGGSKLGETPIFVPKIDADIFHIDAAPNKFGRNIIYTADKKALDRRGSGTNLIFYPRHNGGNQQMEAIFNHNGHFQIRVLGGKCVNFATPNLAIEKCDTTPAFSIDIISADLSLPPDALKEHAESISLEKVYYMVEKIARGLEKHHQKVLSALHF